MHEGTHRRTDAQGETPVNTAELASRAGDFDVMASIAAGVATVAAFVLAAMVVKARRQSWPMALLAPLAIFAVVVAGTSYALHLASKNYLEQAVTTASGTQRDGDATSGDR